MARRPDATTDDILAGVDLAGTTALVTGASSGLGVDPLAHDLRMLDLADLTSVRAVDGFETQFGTNHLDHFVPSIAWRRCSSGRRRRVSSW